MDQVRRVSDRWDEHLARVGQRDVERLYGEQRARGLLMHDRPVCAVARPHFVSDVELSQHRQIVQVLTTALAKARDHVVADRERDAAYLGRFYDWIGDLIRLEPAAVDHGAITRLDAFRSASGLHFIEFNADCPGGADHNDGLVETFRALDTFRAIDGEFDLEPLLLQPAVVGERRSCRARIRLRRAEEGSYGTRRLSECGARHADQGSLRGH